VTGTPGDAEVEALVIDRYLDALLARRPAEVQALPADLATAAARLTTDLPRFHPSFRFEEHLAMRLAQAAAASPVPAEPAAIVAFPAQVPPPGHAMRPVVIGSVLTSAAISLAGAAFVAWRRTHPTPEAAMARAVRAIARARIA
jgi:hypothetical protein